LLPEIKAITFKYLALSFVIFNISKETSQVSLVMGNQASKPPSEPAEHDKDALDASHPNIKYTLEVLLDSDVDYQKVDCNPANGSLSFHPAETSSPKNKTPQKRDNLPTLHSHSFDKVSSNCQFNTMDLKMQL
jgi:hypothetical protein